MVTRYFLDGPTAIEVAMGINHLFEMVQVHKYQ
jgi:hypothetical protein